MPNDFSHCRGGAGNPGPGHASRCFCPAARLSRTRPDDRGRRRNAQRRRHRAARCPRSARCDDPWRQLKPGSDAPTARREARQKSSGDPDRPSRTWLEHARASGGFDPGNPGQNDRRGAGKTWRRPGYPGGSFLERGAWRAHGARSSQARRRSGLLAPVAYPWRGGIGWHTKLVAIPVIGPLLAYTITLPLGYFLAGPGARGVFLPQVMPDGFVGNTATALALRPREFLANARAVVSLRAAVEWQRPPYVDITMP